MAFTRTLSCGLPKNETFSLSVVTELHEINLGPYLYTNMQHLIVGLNILKPLLELMH